MADEKEILAEVKKIGENVGATAAKADNADKEAKAAKEAAEKAATDIEAVKKSADKTAEDVKTIGEDIKVIKDAADKNQKALDRLLIEGKGGAGKVAKKSFGSAFAEEAEKSYDMIQKGQPFTMQVKDVGDMTMTNTVGGIGEGFPTINPQPIINPGQLLNFRDLVKTYPTATGIYWQYRESGGEGQIGAQVEGQAKPQKDYTFNKDIYTVDFVSGYARVTRQLLQDLPFIQNVLPQLLLRDFMIRENQLFYASLLAAIPEGSTAATVNADQIIDTVAELEENNFASNGVVMRPTRYAEFYKYKGSGSGDYTYPGVLRVNNDGSMSINGTPLLKGNWVDSTRAIIGNWDYAKIIQASNLEIRFFEQDANNVTENKVTVRIEARQGLAIDLAGAFRKITLAQ